MSKVALITGINGQDGSYLAELLLDKGYEVHGILKRNSVAENQTARIKVYDQIKDNLTYADMTDLASLNRVLSKVQPDEIYNLAAQSHVRISFDQPVYTANTVAIGTLNLLEATLSMCQNVVECIDQTFETFEPRKSFELTKIEKLPRKKIVHKLTY